MTRRRLDQPPQLARLIASMRGLPPHQLRTLIEALEGDLADTACLDEAEREARAQRFAQALRQLKAVCTKRRR